MAHTVEVGDVLQMRILTRLGSQPGIVIRHWEVTNLVNPTGTLIEYLAEYFDGLLHTLVKAVLVAAAEYVGVGIKRLFPNPTDESLSLGNTGVGTVAGHACPPQTAGLIRLNTGSAGRKNRGRAYLPFPGEASCAAGGIPEAAYITSAQAVAGVLKDVHTPADAVPNQSTLIPVILHKDPTPPRTIQITTATVLPAWATQRRRGLLTQGATVP